MSNDQHHPINMSNHLPKIKSYIRHYEVATLQLHAFSEMCQLVIGLVFLVPMYATMALGYIPIKDLSYYPSFFLKPFV